MIQPDLARTECLHGTGPEHVGYEQLYYYFRGTSGLKKTVQCSELCFVQSKSVHLAHQLKGLLYTHLIICEIMRVKLLGLLSKVSLAKKMASF